MKSKCITLFTINDVWFDQRMQKVADELCKRGYEVTWFARKKSETTSEHNFNFKTYRVQFLFNKGIFFYLEYAIRQFLYLLSNKNTEIVWCCDPDTLTGIYLINLFKKKKFIYDSHEFFCETPEFQNKFIRKKIWKTVERWGVNHSVLNITVASNLGKKLEQVYGKPFRVLMNTPLSFEDFIPVQREKIIIYQGVLNKGRGLECAIDAMRSLPDYHLWICGEGDLSDQLRRKSYGMNNVTFFGLLKPDDLNRKTKKAKFGLNLLDLKSQSYYYSLANKFFDYAASGVVSINSPGIEYLTLEKQYHHSLILEKLEPEMLVSLINNTPQQQINNMADNGLKMVRDNLWDFSQIEVKIKNFLEKE